MFTFSCKSCHKVHTIDGPFPGPYHTDCFRCRAPIHVTRDVVQVGPDTGLVVPKPAAPAATRAPAATTISPAPKPRPATPPVVQPSKQATPTSPSPAAPARPAAPAAPAAAKPPRRGRRLLIVALAATSLLTLAGSAYVVFGTNHGLGKAASPRTRRAPLTRYESSPRGKSAREIVVAALSSRGRKFARVKIREADFEDGALTLQGQAPSPALKQEAEAVAVAAVLRAGWERPRRVRNRLQEPLDVVKEAVARKFGKEVTLKRVSLEGDRLVLEGEVSKWEYLLPAREVAVQALEEAGLGPINAWENHLRKPKK